MKILICEDHEMFRSGVRMALATLPDLTLLAEAANAAETLAKLKNDSFDVALIDINLPGKSGLQLLGEIKTKWPHVKVLMLSQYAEEQYALLTLKLGASGYLNKLAAPGELIKAINTVMKGEIYRSEWLRGFLSQQPHSEKIVNRHDVLSAREFPVLLLLAQGKLYKEIADELNISDNTVAAHKNHIMRKMKFANDAEMNRYCLKNGLI